MSSQQKDYHGIDAYFTTAEFAEFSEYEKLRMKNMKMNYEMMIEVGLDVPPPDFMRNPPGVSRRKRRPRIKDDDSESDDETWVPGRSRGRKRVPTFKVPLKKTKVSQKEKLKPTPPQDESDDAFEALANIDISNIKFEGVDTSAEANQRREVESPEQKEKRVHTTSKDASSGTETTKERRYPVREGTRKCYRDLEAPDDDAFVYCEDCHELHKDDCPTHPLTIIEDRAVPSRCKKRAKRSLPSGLVVKEAGIEGAGKGVWAEKFFPKGVRFGPYGGEVVDEKVGRESGYAWEIFCDSKSMHYINGQSKRKANWMRYVNCARNEAEQNLIAYQYRGQIYYRSFKPILPGTELLVFYGEEYAKELGIKECNFVNDGEHHECQFCGILFTGKLFLLKHLKYWHHQHVDLTPYISRNSPTNRSLSKVSSGEGEERVQSIISFPIDNTECENYFKKINSSDYTGEVRTHMNAHVGQRHLIDKVSQCKRFKMNFKLQERLREHEKKCRTTGCMIKCQVCKKVFSSSYHLKNHKEIHTKIKPDERGDRRVQERIHTGQKPYQRRHCNKAFTQSGDLRAHERIHTGQKPYQCRHCNKAFTQSGHLRRHEMIHTGQKPYQCRHCNKAFTQSGDLRRHERVHTGQKPYQCRHCNKAFTQSGDLRRHERIHTGQKPYQCRHCNKAFTQSSVLRTHERIHTGQKPYQCRHCNKAFTKSNNLRAHERIHTGQKPYQCRHCNKAFTQSSVLRTHERIHTGQKPYQCRHCNKAFTKSNNLRAHERIHTGQKAYQCRYCNKAFTQSGSLRKHEMIHTGQKD